MTVSLDAALSGLKAAQRSLDVISNNIANAQTTGFTRKILPQEALVVGGNGLGVQVQAITRNVDKALLRDLIRQVSVSESHTVTQKFLDRIQDFHGPSESERAISARIGVMADAFAELSGAPESDILLSKTLASAQQVARTFNDFSSLLTQMRNQAEEEITAAIRDVNQALSVISDLNVNIASLTSAGRSTADLEDQRDMALRTVSKYMQITTFSAENNKLVIMTRQGQTLADENARTLVFNSNNLLPGSYYPGGGAEGIFIDSPTGIEITGSGIGGQIGALIEMRDQVIPTYTAQIDEMAQKMASRFDAAGLRLFTDGNGNVPANVAPPGLVGYVGFAGQIRVNRDVETDPTLLRSGTTGATVPSGSNEIIRKVSEFALGAYAYEQGTGTADISAGTLFASLGLTQVNRVTGNVDLTDYLPDLDAAPNIAAPASFDLTLGGVPYAITINPGDTGLDLVNNINTAVGSAVASLNGLGQLDINFGGSIAFSDVTIGAAGMADLGFSFGVTAAQNPSFSVQVGTQSPVTISIGAADTAATILASLNAITGLTASLGTGGELILTPTYGGDLTVQNVVGTPLTALGMSVAGVAHTPFRQSNLGPDGSISTGLVANTKIEDYARSVVTDHAQDHALNSEKQSKEEAFFGTLERRHLDQSGVDIDQEISELVKVQTAYTAAARMITATEKMFDDLLAAFL